MFRNLLERDRRLYLILHSRLRAVWIDPLMVWLTKAGTKGVLWLGIAAGLFLDSGPGGRWTAILSVAALLVAEGAINLVLKPLFARERPYQRQGRSALLVSPPGRHSWPSAHAGSSLAAAAVLASAYHGWGVPLLAIALLIGYSRIYVGVHYPFDVLAGDLVGLASAGVVLVAGGFLHGAIHIP